MRKTVYPRENKQHTGFTCHGHPTTQVVAETPTCTVVAEGTYTRVYGLSTDNAKTAVDVAKTTMPPTPLLRGSFSSFTQCIKVLVLYPTSTGNGTNFHDHTRTPGHIVRLNSLRNAVENAVTLATEA